MPEAVWVYESQCRVQSREAPPVTARRFPPGSFSLVRRPMPSPWRSGSIGDHDFDVAHGAPRVFPEPDPPRYSARMADETVVVARQLVHTAVGVFGVIVAEPVAEGTVPERPQAPASRRVKSGHSRL